MGDSDCFLMIEGKLLQLCLLCGSTGWCWEAPARNGWSLCDSCFNPQRDVIWIWIHSERRGPNTIKSYVVKGVETNRIPLN